MQHLYRLHAEGLDAVEDPLAGAEQHRGDVECGLVDDSSDKRLPDDRGAARDVHAVIIGARQWSVHLRNKARKGGPLPIWAVLGSNQ